MNQTTFEERLPDRTLVDLDGDQSERKYSEDELAKILGEFSKNHFPWVQQDSLPNREHVLKVSPCDRLKDFGSMEKVPFDRDMLARCGFEVMIQILYSAYAELMEKYLKTKSELAQDAREKSPDREQVEVLAPETPEMLTPVKPAANLYVPETLEPNFQYDNENNGVEAVVEPSSKALEYNTEESPSILSMPRQAKCSLSKEEKGVVTLDDSHDNDDFEENEALSVIQRRAGGHSGGAGKNASRWLSKDQGRRVKGASGYRMTVEPPLSKEEVKKLNSMKQTSIVSHFTSRNSLQKRRTESDIEKALRLSVESERVTQSKKRSTKSDKNDLAANDSFNTLPTKAPKLEDLGYQYVHAPVRKQSERKELLGFDCDECRAWYKGSGLSEEEIQRKIQKCSRHRAKFIPRPDSPKEIWKVGIESDEELEKTQVGPPLRSRRQRYKKTSS